MSTRLTRRTLLTGVAATGGMAAVSGANDIRICNTRNPEQRLACRNYHVHKIANNLGYWTEFKLNDDSNGGDPDNANYNGTLKDRFARMMMGAGFENFTDGVYDTNVDAARRPSGRKILTHFRNTLHPDFNWETPKAYAYRYVNSQNVLTNEFDFGFVAAKRDGNEDYVLGPTGLRICVGSRHLKRRIRPVAIALEAKFKEIQGGDADWYLSYLPIRARLPVARMFIFFYRDSKKPAGQRVLTATIGDGYKKYVKRLIVPA